MYGLCIISGFFACVFTAVKILKNINKFEIFVLGAYIFFGVFAGGHILFGLINLDFTQSILYTFRGSVYYGGFLGALFMVWLYTKKSPVIPKGTAFDTFALCTPLFHFFGRIGCSFAGCCYGILLGNGSGFPVQLTESFCNLLIFALMTALFSKDKYKGRLIYYYIIMYAPLRFFLEFLRGDGERGIFILSVSQWISLFLIVFVIIKSFLQNDKKH